MPKKQIDTVKFKGKMMMQKKFGQALSLILSFELLVAPLSASAQDQRNFLTTTNNALNMAGSMLGAVSGQAIGAGGLSSQAQIDMQSLTLQQAPQEDKYFNSKFLSQIPGLANYLALNNINPASLQCSTLRTTLYEAKNEVCRIGITNDKGDPRLQLNEAFTYYNQYLQTTKVYENYSAISNAQGQGFGIGCMQNAMNILNGFFKYRSDELDALMAKLEAINDNFKKMADVELKQIEQATGMLEGDPLASKYRAENSANFELEKSFDNAACKSLMGQDKFKALAKNGLNGINGQLKETLSTKVGKYSGETYTQASATITEDINKIANSVAEQFKLNFSSISAGEGYSGFVGGLKTNISSTTGLNEALNADLFTGLQTSFNTEKAKLQSEVSIVASELSSGGSSNTRVFSNLTNLNAGDFENNVTSIENDLKNDCLKRSLTGTSSIDTVISKIYDPTSSKFANQNAASFFKDKIRPILENSKTSVEKKLQELQLVEGQAGKKYLIKENTYEVQGLDANGKLTSTIVNASNKRSPSSFFTSIITNCQAQFKANRLGNKLTGEQAVAKLRELKNNYKTLSNNHSAQVASSLKNRLLNCTDTETANNTATGSCTPERFDTSKSTFCAAAANSCAINMQKCQALANKMVTDVKAKREPLIQSYKNNMQKNMKDIVALFDQALKQYTADGQKLGGLFNANFKMPTGIVREVPEDQKYLSELQSATANSQDGVLRLEDPKAFVEMFRQNIQKLQKSVLEQQNQILGGGPGSSSGLLAQHVNQTKQNYSEVASKSKSYADACLRIHDTYVSQDAQRQNKQYEEAAKQQAELGEKLPLFCKKYKEAFSEHPNGACKGDIQELMKAAMKASVQSGNGAAMEAVAAFGNMCDGFNNEADGSPTEVQALEKCLSTTDDSLKKLCEQLQDCQKVKTISSSTEKTKTGETVIEKCEESLKTALANKIVQSSSTKTKINIAAPFFCESGYTGQSNNKGNFSSGSSSKVLNSAEVGNQ